MKKFILMFFVCFFICIATAEASIMLKIIAVNPSKTQSQKASVRSYLPKETKPENIIDKEDLDVSYDTQQGSYFVYGDYDLKPGEVLEKNIELQDIWVIPNNEIESLRLEARKTRGMLANTEFADRAAFLCDGLESKLNQIIEIQGAPPANPEKHISNYRDDLRILESAKADLVLVRSLLSQAKNMPTVIIWRLIIAILIFLGLLGSSFYFIWHKQLKTINDTFPKEAENPPAGPQAAAEPSSESAKPEDKTNTA